MIDWQNIFDQKIRTSDDIRKVATGQGDGYRTGCLIDYNYFKNYYKMIAMDLSKQAFDGDPKAMLQINFTGNLENQTVLNYSLGIVKVS